MRRRMQEQRGQSLIEFAIVLPIFMLIVVGIFEAAYLVYSNASLSQAAREGARLASTEAGWIGISGRACVADTASITDANPGAHVCPPNIAALEADVVSAVNRMTVGLGPVSSVYLSCNTGAEGDPAPEGQWTDESGGNGCRSASGTALGSTGDLVSVRVEYTHNTFTPFLNSLIGSMPLSGSSTMVIN